MCLRETHPSIYHYSNPQKTFSNQQKMSQVGQTDTSQNKKHSNQMCEQKMVVSMQANGLM